MINNQRTPFEFLKYAIIFSDYLINFLSAKWSINKIGFYIAGFIQFSLLAQCWVLRGLYFISSLNYSISSIAVFCLIGNEILMMLMAFAITLGYYGYFLTFNIIYSACSLTDTNTKWKVVPVESTISIILLNVDQNCFNL